MAHPSQHLRHQATSTTFNTLDLETICSNLNSCIQKCNFPSKVKVAPVNTHRLGLVATRAIQPGESLVSIPLDAPYVLSANRARQVFQDVLGTKSDFKNWSGDAGWIALLVLRELAQSTQSSKAAESITNNNDADALLQAWMDALPFEFDDHPYLWNEDDQECLQMSSTNKIYRKLDDLEDDATWLEENIFSKDRTRFPQTVTRNGVTVNCFSLDGFKWAMAIVQSRSIFVENLLLVPFLDFCNHADNGKEVTLGRTGTFGTIKSAELISSQACKAGDEVFCSYGPKSAADYLMEHGFCPDQCWKTAVSELTFEIDPQDRFRDDKLDILEFETYDQAPMDPVQSFDVVSAPGRDGQPDPAMLQFVRLCMLGSTDAFLLESIFRKEVWGFMAEPVSEMNELQVFSAINAACQAALDDMNDCPDGGPEVCAKLIESEKKALTKTMEFLRREREAIDLKEYYQERRLKDLGLDSNWSPENEVADSDLGVGQTRTPGGADYDW
jgi:[ribulose-bisphosphate carboxylase]-lysine N-methyltransferase